jgi:hypothetical protein
MHRAGRISPLPFVSRVPTLGQQLAHTLSLRQGALPSLVNQVNFAPSNSNSKLAPLSCQTGRTAAMQLVPKATRFIATQSTLRARGGWSLLHRSCPGSSECFQPHLPGEWHLLPRLWDPQI